MMNLKNYAEIHGMKILTVFFDISKKRVQGRYCLFNEGKNTYTECTPETKPF